VVSPARSTGGQRRYTRHEIGDLQDAIQLVGEGMSLAAVRRIFTLQQQVRDLREELARERAAGAPGATARGDGLRSSWGTIPLNASSFTAEIPSRMGKRSGVCVCLNGPVVDQPALRTMRMADVADKPVHGYADGDTHAHTPHEPRQTPEQLEDDGYWNLLKHPRALKETIERVVADTGTRVEDRWVSQPQLAVQVPPTIFDWAIAVPQKRMAVRLSLRPVTEIV
jgi:hypothetical protein